MLYRIRFFLLFFVFLFAGCGRKVLEHKEDQNFEKAEIISYFSAQ